MTSLLTRTKRGQVRGKQHLLLAAYYLLLTTTHYSLLTTHYSLLTTHHSLLTTYYSLLTYQMRQRNARAAVERATLYPNHGGYAHGGYCPYAP